MIHADEMLVAEALDRVLRSGKSLFDPQGGRVTLTRQ
jgi:hypothetical protein